MADGKDVLVTGAAGFLGAHVVRDLLARPDGEVGRVVAMDDLSGGFVDNLPDDDRVRFVEASVCDPAEVSRVFADHDFDRVYHLAAYAAEGLSHFIRRFNYVNNVVGSINVLNESINHEVKTFVFTSSIAVYGAGAGDGAFKEDDTPTPEDPYGVAKYAVEMDLRAAHEMFGIETVVFRPHNVYGEFQNIGDRYRNVVGIFMNQIMRGEPLTIFGDGTQVRAFTYVGDIAPLIARCDAVPAAAGGVFNVGAGHGYTVNELADAVREVMGVPDHPVRHLEARNEVHTAVSDHAKAEAAFAPVMPEAVPLKEGLARMADWARKVGSRESGVFEGVEVARNMPPSWAALTQTQPAGA